jgi:hypothetical protein
LVVYLALLREDWDLSLGMFLGFTDITMSSLFYFFEGLLLVNGLVACSKSSSLNSTILGFWFNDLTWAFDKNCLVPLLRKGFLGFYSLIG